MDKFVKLALFSLATYRLTKLVMEDEITSGIRDKVISKFEQYPKVEYFIYCPWCVSVWAGAGLLVLDHVAPAIGEVTQKVLTASAVTGIINTRF